jgi:hypothetical protein
MWPECRGVPCNFDHFLPILQGLKLRQGSATHQVFGLKKLPQMRNFSPILIQGGGAESEVVDSEDRRSQIVE